MSRVFVKNLPKAATEKDLALHFSNCGTITDTLISKNQQGNSRCIGYVGFAEAESVDKALLTCNNTYLRGRKIIVMKAVSHKVAEQNELKSEKTHLSSGAKALCEQIIGEGNDMLKQYLNQNRGWKDEAILPAVAAQPVKKTAKLAEEVKRDAPEEVGEVDDQKIKLLNVPEMASEEQLLNHFKAFGEVSNVTISTNVITKKPTGVAFVTYAVPESARKAVGAEETLFLGCFVKIVQARTSPVADFVKKREYSAKGFDKNNRLAWNPLVQRSQVIASALASYLGEDAKLLGENAVAMAAAEAFMQQDVKAYFELNGLSYDPAEDVPRSKQAVLCKKVPYDVTEGDMKALFEQFGIVVSCTRVCPGFFLVKMAQPSDCRRAFNKIAFKKLGREKVPVLLEFARLKSEVAVAKQKSEETKQQEEIQPLSTLYIKNVSFGTTTQEIEGIVKSLIPEAQRLQIPQNDISHKGYFFVSVLESQEADALQKLSSTLHNGFRWEASRSRRQDSVYFSTKLVVKNLAFYASPQELRDLLGYFGRVVSLRCPKKLDGGLRGFAFAEFVTAREAQAAAYGLTGVHFYGRPLICEAGKEEDVGEQDELEKQ